MTESKRPSQVQMVEVPPERDGQRLDNFLLARLNGVPRSKVYRIIRKGEVRVDGKRVKPFRKLKAGEVVRVPPVRMSDPDKPTVPRHVVELVESRILYEDENCLVVNKPSGMAVHAGSGVRWGLIDAMRVKRTNLDLVHRLDRETSGCMILARTHQALKHLGYQFQDRSASKKYFALLDGTMPDERVIVDQPLAKVERSGERFVEVRSDGKPASTEFRQVERYGDCTLVEAQPFTGRTHQIRAHAVFMGAPLAGDNRYASESSLARYRDKGLKRLFLHAHALTVTSVDGEVQHFSCPLDEDLGNVLENIE